MKTEKIDITMKYELNSCIFYRMNKNKVRRFGFNSTIIVTSAWSTDKESEIVYNK